MENTQLIPAAVFCTSHNIEITFLQNLQDSGLIEVKKEAEEYFVQIEQIRAIEKLIHLHYELEVNLAGLEVIHHLLQREEEKYKELIGLRNKLAFFEEG